MAYAITRGNAPLKDDGWREGQFLVADLLERIARAGSPRCCKRDARIAVEAAVPAFNRLDGPKLRESRRTPRCASSALNTVCMGSACPYYPE